MRLSELIDVAIVRRIAEANYEASGMPIGIVDAVDGAILVGVGWQDICLMFHRANAITAERCRESDAHIEAHLSDGAPCEYVCKNGLRDIGVPVTVAGQHLATLFLGQFFYAGEAPDRQFFVEQARRVGFDEGPYLAALDRVPVFTRAQVENILRYDVALAEFIGALAERAHEHAKDEAALRDAERRRSDFIAMLSHELRNPLAPLRNALYMLERPGVVSEHGVKALAIANRQARHLARLVDDLMDVTRLSTGEYHLDRHRVDVAEVVRSAVEDHRSIAADHGLTIEAHVPREPAIVHGDAARLAQVVGNLLTNAAKFTDEGGKIVVTLERDASHARLRVRDTGIGISPELLGTVFEPFVQADTTLARSRGGLGLGLAVVNRLVALHGGTVGAHSEGPGRGAEFVVELPVADATARPPQIAADAGAGRRVLIIEDNDDTAATLKDILEFQGHEVRVEPDGLRGLDTAARFRPEIVLCDIGLPGIDGYEVARRLRATEGPRLVLVAVTGYSSPDDVRRAEAAGFDHHVPKPADLDQVTRLVSEARAVH